MFKKNLPLFFLFSVFFLIFLTNYHPNTWLTGWDNLHPEFNLVFNIKRSLFASWQEYQGLGLLGGMGHASDLPRQIFLWFFSLALPASLIRYFYHFLMLFLGPLGVFFLLNIIIFKQSKQPYKKYFGLIGALFYLFNLATLQMFYVPFEAYSAHYAFLPWLFLINLNFLNKVSKKSFFLLLLINILAISQGYVATYFLVYTLALSLVFLFYFLMNRKGIKKILIASLVLFCINAFWLIPNLYFVASNLNVYTSAKINQMATENNFLTNKKYGDLANVLILKGFWFENTEINQEGNLDYQMGNWVNHFQNPIILGIGYSIFLLSLMGIFFAIKKRITNAILFILVFLLAFTFLANDTPIFSQISNLFYQLPLLSQIFRFPFTKFSILAALCLSIFYSITLSSISTFLKRSSLKTIVSIFFIFLPLIFLFPIFQGDLFDSKNRIKIPEEYFQVFKFFQNQDKNTRIATLPQHTYWGWHFYHWDYHGSGFLWYGIEQPILDRAFDPWSDKNENYYWEISQAIYSQNKVFFEKVLEKYQVNWLLVDGYLINPSSPKALFSNETEEMLATSNKIYLSQEFGKIKIYQVNLETPVNNFVFLAENLPQVVPDYQWNNFDQAFLENGHYLSQTQEQEIFYPFRSLFTGRGQEELEFNLEEQENFFLFKKELPFSSDDYQLIIPAQKEGELVFVDPENLAKSEFLNPEVFIQENTLIVKVPKVKGLYSAEIEPFSAIDFNSPKNCQSFSQGSVENKIIQENGQFWLNLRALNSNNCSASFWLPNLSHRYAYLITVKSQYKQGKSLVFWLENLTSKRADIETQLPKKEEITAYFIQPPMTTDGLGYSLHFDNISLGRVKTENNLGKIIVNPIPYRFLIGIKLIKTQPESQSQTLPLTVDHPNPSFYQVKRGFTSSQVLILSQAFHSGWQAYELKNKTHPLLIPFFNKRIENHFLVNNWENGWQLGQEENIAIIFLPQYLEYFGFLIFLLFICFTLVFLVK